MAKLVLAEVCCKKCFRIQNDRGQKTCDTVGCGAPREFLVSSDTTSRPVRVTSRHPATVAVASAR